MAAKEITERICRWTLLHEQFLQQADTHEARTAAP
jgi:hypothetical protein